LKSWLFGVGRTDLATFGAVSVGLLLTALVACASRPPRRERPAPVRLTGTPLVSVHL